MMSALVEIRNRCTGEVICAGETLMAAVEANAARLVCASLHRANLVGASLDGASLVGASLVGASLDGARLDSARLDSASLDGARLAWQSHDLLAEILRRAAGDNIAKLKVAGLILVCRDKCWMQMLEIAARDPLGGWALDELARRLHDGDCAPDELVERAAKLCAQEAPT